MLRPQRNDLQFSSDSISCFHDNHLRIHSTISFLPNWWKSVEQASSGVPLCKPHLSQRPATSLCIRSREGWARSRMNGSQLYRGWAMKPLSQVAAAPGQVAFVRAHMHACSLFVPTLSLLCWFPLCLSTTQARCNCTVSQNGPYCVKLECVAHTWHHLQTIRHNEFWFLETFPFFLGLMRCAKPGQIPYFLSHAFFLLFFALCEHSRLNIPFNSGIPWMEWRSNHSFQNTLQNPLKGTLKILYVSDTHTKETSTTHSDVCTPRKLFVVERLTLDPLLLVMPLASQQRA